MQRGQPEFRWRSALLGVLIGFVTPAWADNGRQFDCVDAFDAITLATTLACPRAETPGASTGPIASAIQRLIALGDFSATAFDDVAIAWCPMPQALGYTPDPARIWLSAGLKVGSTDLLAEVIAHEMVHIRQFRELGVTAFKCAYVDAFIRCGACQDRGHALEEPAYQLQDSVREHLLEQWLEPPTDSALPAPASAGADPH
jgi:hypothetical protein